MVVGLVIIVVVVVVASSGGGASISKGCKNVFFVLELYLVLLRAYSRFCPQGSLLVEFKRP